MKAVKEAADLDSDDSGLEDDGQEVERMHIKAGA